jgi:RNA polymerase sigma factor for flagellar operon FliA
MSTNSSKQATQAAAFDPAERERLLQENLSEVRYIARRIHDRLPPHVPFDDLVHAGILGLIDAIDKYDPSRNVQLKSYARFRIRGAILDSLRQMDWSPRALRRQARRIEDTQRELSATLGRAPNETEIAAHLGMPLEEYQHLLGELRGLDLGSLYAGVDEEQADNPHLSLTAKEEEDPFSQCLRSEMRSLLAEAIEELGEKERHVLGLYYLEELTMKEVGVILDIGESRVSQIHTAAILRLRGRLREKLEAQRQSRVELPAREQPV